jgi:crotonobetainyl-CoA:carnitine CoA-transferase CaiB-like acyl-CoA transferase
VADLTAGIFLAQGVLVALLERERSGRGQWVHTSLLQAMVTMLDFQATRWLIGKEIPPQAGNDHPTGIPTGVFRTADGHINIAASGQQMFRRLCEALGTKELIDDPRFKAPPDRSKNRALLTEELEKTTLTRSSQQWVATLNAAGVPCGPILTVKEVFEDPQIRHLGMATKITHPRLGQLEVQNLPVTLSRTPGAVRMPTAELGEHTDEVLGELGYSTEEVAALHREGAV